MSDYRAEQRAREARVGLENQIKADEVESFLRLAETDAEASLVVAVAKKIDPDTFASRENVREWVERKRKEPGANERAEALNIHLRTPSVVLWFTLRRARAIIALVRGDDSTVDSREAGDR